MALAPTRRQAIIWTNDGMIYWRIYTSQRIYASLGHNDIAYSGP